MRAKLREWIGIDSDTAAIVDLVASVEKSVINRCAETQSYCVSLSEDLRLNDLSLQQQVTDHADKIGILRTSHVGLIQDLQQSHETILKHHERIVELEKRYAELLAMVVDMETKAKEPVPKPLEDPEVAGSWSRTRRRAESAA